MLEFNKKYNNNVDWSLKCTLDTINILDVQKCNNIFKIKKKP